MADKTLADIGHDTWFCNVSEEMPGRSIPLSSRSPVYQKAWHAAADAIRDAVMEACISQVKEIAKRAENQGRTDDASLCESLALNLESLKRSDKENGDG